MQEVEANNNQLKQSVIDIVAKAWQFRRVFAKAMTKLDLLKVQSILASLPGLAGKLNPR